MTETTNPSETVEAGKALRRLNPQVLYLIASQYTKLTSKAPQRGLGAEETVRKIRWDGATWSVGTRRIAVRNRTVPHVVLFEEREGTRIEHLLSVEDLHDGILCEV